MFFFGEIDEGSYKKDIADDSSRILTFFDNHKYKF